MKSEEEIKALLDFDIKHFKDTEEHLLFALDHIEHHIPELRELNAEKNPHLYDEIADVYILAKMILLANDVKEDVVLKRIERFREKIKQFR